MPLREKDHEHNHNEKVQTLTPELQAFYGELAVKFPKIRVTSAKREASQKVGKASATSRHNTGEAFDISAQDKDVADYLMNDIEGAALLTKYGLGLLDETNPETIKKTGATGAHFHIGKDPALVQKAMVRYEALSKQQPKQKPQPITLQTQIQGQPITTTVDPIQFEKEVQKEEKKKEKAEEKAEKSEARKRLEEKKEKQKAFLDALQVPNSIVSYKQDKQEQYDIEEPFQLDLPETPNQLPSLPSMFQMPDVIKQKTE
jgi:ssDNA-binding Zn-finger/Zn-ribbon topoisomerase 1